VSVAAIRKENSLKSSTLSVGQKLRITTTKRVSVVVRKHKVARGDYLGKIARQYDVSIASLRQTNKLRSDTLSVGQILIIPNR
jgi:N-acetylmuramoyl-L-alanine amidase